MATVLATVMFGTPPSGPLGGACAGNGYCQVAVAPAQPGQPIQGVAGGGPVNQGGGTTTGTSSTTSSGNDVTDDAHIVHPAHKGTLVAFELSPLDKSVLMMSFRLSDLEKNQPEQVASFKKGEYNFEADYHFRDHHLFNDLAFHHNPRIEKGKKNSVHISGDLVTTFFHYTHD